MTDAEDLFLTDAELETLTGLRRPSAQARALRRLGVRHFVRPVDGRPVVRRKWLDGKTAAPSWEPDYDALDGPEASS